MTDDVDAQRGRTYGTGAKDGDISLLEDVTGHSGRGDIREEERERVGGS